MPRLGSGSYPTSTDVDASTRFVVYDDGGVKEAPGATAKSFMLPDGIVDVADYSTTTELQLVSCDSTTGFAGTGGHSGAAVALDTSVENEGTGCVSFLMDFDVSGSPIFYYTFTSPQSITGRTLVAFDFRYSKQGPAGFEETQCLEAVVADSTALTGNQQTVVLPSVPEDIWTRLLLPLGGLTAIKSIGIRRTVNTGISNSRSTLYIDDIGFPAESKLDLALGSATNVGVVVSPDYSPNSIQMPLYLPSGKAVIDPALGVYSKANNVVYLHDYLAHVVGAETGVIDVAAAIGRIINSAESGQVVRGTPGATYRISHDISITDLVDVVIDFTGCALFIDYQSNTPAFTTSGCTRVSWVGGQWFGYGPTTHLGVNLTTVAGSPTNSGNNKLLDALDEEVRFSYNDTVPFAYARVVPQQVGLADDGLGPRNYFTFTLSDSAQVANDCTVYIMDQDGNTLATSTLTLTTTPTVYALSLFPTDIHDLLDIRIKKNTATANTITIGDSTSHGRASYSSTYDVASAHLIESSYETTYEDMLIEGFGGDAIQVSNAAVRRLYVRRVVSRGMRRQGMSFNQGNEMHISDCVVGETGRSGIDFEPFASTWFTSDVSVRSCKFYNVTNYCFAMSNFSRNFDYVIDDIDCFGVGLGIISGGAMRAEMTNMRNWTQGASPGVDYIFKGSDMKIRGIRSVRGIECSTNSNVYNGVEYTPANNTLADIDLRNAAGGRKLTMATGYELVGDVAVDPTVRSDFAATTTPFGPVDSAGKAFAGINFGEYRRQLPNTYKGANAFSDVWVPGGLNLLAEPTYNARSLSGSLTRGNNLRSIEASVTQTATSVALTFPTRTVGSLNVASTAASSATSGSLSSSTTYYYRVAPRGVTAGPATYLSQFSGTTSSGHTAMTLTLKGWLDHTNELLVAGITVLRGTVNGGPYTTRYDVVPNEPLYGPAINGVTCTDLGTSLTVTGGDSSFGYASSYTASSGSWTGSVDESGYEPDASYAVMVETNWATTVYISAKTTAGFTINFGTAAPASAKVSWLLVR